MNQILKPMIIMNPNVGKKRRLEIKQRCLDMEKVIEYDILAKKDDRKIADWRSYPGLNSIIDMAREIVETGKKEQIEKLAELMQGHESQQSATIVTTIAILVGNKMDTEEISVSEECRRAFGDIMLWNTPVITSRDTWPFQTQVLVYADFF